MRIEISRAFVVIPIVVLVATVTAADFKSGRRVKVAEGDTLTEDLYGAGQTIEILGTAMHDLVLAGQRLAVEGTVGENLYGAGQTVLISGSVGGDITAAGNQVELDGTANSGIRAAGQTVIIAGIVNGDAVMAGSELIIEPDAVVTGDVIAGGELIEIDGTVKGFVNAAGNRTVIRGNIENDVEVRVGESLVLEPGSRIGGNLTYHHTQALELANAQVVAGEIKFKPLEVDGESFTFSWLKRIWVWLSMLAVGLIILALGYGRVQNMLNRTSEKPLPTMGFGVLMLIAVPFAILFSLITVLLIPFALILLGAFLIFAYVGMIFSGTFIGREVLRRIGGPAESLYVAMLAGVSLLLLLTLIPVAGGVIWLLALVAGLGMILLGLIEVVKKARVAAR